MIVSRQLRFIRNPFRRDPRKLAGLPDEKYIVGRDHFGNEYYEMPGKGRPKRMTSQGIGLRII